MTAAIPTISTETALAIVQAALAAARRQGLAIAAAVTDSQGHVVASARMDGVPPAILGFADDKAYTAATMRRSTQAFAERMASKPSLTLGLSTRSRLLAWGGGLPIVDAGRIVGAIGVSGAKDDEDIACGQAALAAAGFGWEP